MKTIAPTSITRIVRKFCTTINAEDEPVYIDVRPEPGAAVGDCFPNIDAKIAKDGGELVTGWAIWEWPRALLEGEFHGNWKAPSGEVIDITPKPTESIKQILFLPDASRKFEGKRIDNVRMPVGKDSVVWEYIAAMSAFERHTGNRAGFNRVKVTPELRQIAKKLQRLSEVMDAKY